MFENLVNSCQFLLNNFPDAKFCRDYLDSRLDKSSQSTFQFGYFPNLHHLPALTSLLGEDLLKSLKLLSSSKTGAFSYFENYPLILPFKNQYGEIIGLVGRTLLPESEYQFRKIPKYKNTIFKKGNYLFGLYENQNSIIQQNSVFLVEGQFDVIKARECGLTNVVALGSANMTGYQFSVITRYTNNIFLLLDNDQAGEQGRKRITNKFGKLANIRSFYLPDNSKDIDEYLSQNSYESLSFVIK